MRNMYVIVAGERLGRKIGFPTINLEPAQLDAKLGFGVYVCEVVFVASGKKYKGVLHYGEKKTFDRKKVSLEVHLLDFEGEVYGGRVSLVLGKRIRLVRKFTGVEELKGQIGKDVRIAADGDL